MGFKVGPVHSKLVCKDCMPYMYKPYEVGGASEFNDFTCDIILLRVTTCMCWVDGQHDCVANQSDINYYLPFTKRHT